SMYYDEDGDLAHEFYEETIVTKNGRKRAKLKRIHKNLIPQGGSSDLFLKGTLPSGWRRAELCLPESACSVPVLPSCPTFILFFQGIVKLEHPRIHVDFPVIICEV
ncbi:hypothetical protein CIB84_013102, partial [Bambusicola thoracicus]